VAASAVLTRSNEATVLAATAEHLMRVRLRTQQALSYSPQTSYQRLDATRTHVVLYADGAGEGLAALTHAFGHLVRELAVPQPQAVATIVEAMLKDYREARSRSDIAAMMDLASLADDLLHGRPHKAWEQIEAELEATDPQQVADAGRDFQRDALFELPNVEVDTSLFGTAAPLSTVETPAGQDYRHRDAPLETSRLVVGPYGAASWQGQQLQGAVRFDRLEAATRWADGGLTLIGQDATRLRIEPTLWREGAAAAEKIITRVDPALVVDLGERPPEAVPRPRSTRGQRFAARVKPAAAEGARLMLMVALVVAIILLYVTASLLAHRPLSLPGLVLGIAIVIWLGNRGGNRRR
jgi:zinc protease